jgi:hypothetical protein
MPKPPEISINTPTKFANSASRNSKTLWEQGLKDIVPWISPRL